MEEFQRWGRGRLAGLLVTLAALLLPATASAADSIYWTAESGRYDPGRRTRTARAPPRPCSAARRPCGVAIDPAAGKIYWTNFGGAGSGSRTWTARVPRRPCSTARGPCAGWRSTRRRTRCTGPTSAPTDPGREPGRHGKPRDLFNRGRPERGGDRPRSRQDLLDRPVRRHRQVANLDGTGTPATLFGHAARTTRSAWRSTPQPARSTGPTSTCRQGPSREPGRLGHRLEPVQRREPAGRGGDRPRGGQDLLGQLHRRRDPGREPDGTGTASTLFGGEGGPLFAALLRAPVGTGAPTISGGAGSAMSSPAARGLGARPARCVPVRAPRSVHLSVAKERVGPIGGDTDRPSRPPSPAPTPAV